MGLWRVWLALFAFCFNSQVWAAPDYVTAWPKQVPVEKSDPVLGDKLFWEFWVYGEAFAKRFKGFSVEKTDPELKGKGKIKAMALRIFKINLWQGMNPDYPEQYACEWDVYFDNSLMIPLTGKPKGFIPRQYPKGVSGSYERLDPYEDKDRQAIKTSQPVASNPAHPPLVFAVPLDGRYKLYRVREYHPKLTEDLALLVFSTGAECDVTAPLMKGGAHWLSLLGERPYNRDKDGNYSTLWGAVHGTYQPGIKSIFDPGFVPESKGYFRVPEAFNKAVLPKVTLVKVMNNCINQKDAYRKRTGAKPEDSGEKVFRTCRDIEELGVIRDVYNGGDTLREFGF